MLPFGGSQDDLVDGNDVFANFIRFTQHVHGHLDNSSTAINLFGAQGTASSTF